MVIQESTAVIEKMSGIRLIYPPSKTYYQEVFFMRIARENLDKNTASITDTILGLF